MTKIFGPAKPLLSGVGDRQPVQQTLVVPQRQSLRLVSGSSCSSVLTSYSRYNDATDIVPHITKAGRLTFSWVSYRMERMASICPCPTRLLRRGRRWTTPRLYGQGNTGLQLIRGLLGGITIRNSTGQNVQPPTTLWIGWYWLEFSPEASRRRHTPDFCARFGHPSHKPGAPRAGRSRCEWLVLRHQRRTVLPDPVHSVS